MSKFGFVPEFVYLDDNKQIQSKVLDPADCCPVFDYKGDYVNLIESWTIDNVTYYAIYYPDKVERWTDEGGNLAIRSFACVV